MNYEPNQIIEAMQRGYEISRKRGGEAHVVVLPNGKLDVTQNPSPGEPILIRGLKSSIWPRDLGTADHAIASEFYGIAAQFNRIRHMVAVDAAGKPRPDLHRSMLVDALIRCAILDAECRDRAEVMSITGEEEPNVPPPTWWTRISSIWGVRP